MFKINSRKLPSVIFQYIRTFKPESYIKPDQEISEIKPETNSGGNSKLFVQVFEFELGSIGSAIRFGVFKIPDVTNVRKQRHFKKNCVGKKRRYIKAVFRISFQLNIACAIVKPNLV